MGSDSENQQPDSTTQEPKIEENQESKQEGLYKYIFIYTVYIIIFIL